MLFKSIEKYLKEPNTISKGTLYIGSVFIDNLKEDKLRNIRIYLPSDYDGVKRFPVIYMMDGKNLFDKYTSFMGEWGVDEVIEDRIEKGLNGYIVVGIDSANSDIGRVEEMLPDDQYLNNVDDLNENLTSRINPLEEFIVNDLKKEIDNMFMTLSDYNNTIIGGSSMGGLFAYYMGVKYSNVFKLAICFSPAFCLYEESYFKEELSKIKGLNNKYYFLVGNIEYEQQFVSLTKYTYEYMSNKKYSVCYVHDLEGIHHESFWNKYINNALDYFEL